MNYVTSMSMTTAIRDRMSLLACLVASALLPVLAGCSAYTSLEPVGRGETLVNAGFGGPMVESFGVYLPVPNVTVGARHGMSENVDVDGQLYVMPMMFGIVGLDLGATWYPVIDPNALTIGIHPRVLMLASVKSNVEERFRAYPALSASASGRNGNDRIYGGFDLAFPISKPDYDPDPPPVIFSPFVGYGLAIGSTGRLLFEVKWMGMNVRTNATADFVNPFGLGGLAPLFAYEFAW